MMTNDVQLQAKVGLALDMYIVKMKIEDDPLLYGDCCLVAPQIVLSLLSSRPIVCSRRLSHDTTL
jgi:hypothetical protein